MQDGTDSPEYKLIEKTVSFTDQPKSQVQKPDKENPHQKLVTEDESTIIEQKIVDLRSKIEQADTRDKALGNLSFLETIARDIIQRGDFDPTLVNGIPNDQLLRELVNLYKLYNARNTKFQISEKDWNEIFTWAGFKKKAEIIEVFSSGHFLAHGGYVKDLEDIIRDGGLMSSVTRFEEGLIKPRDVPRWRGKITQPDATGIYFYAWNKSKFAGIYASGPRDHKGTTDMIIIYPSETIVDRAKAISIGGIGLVGEIAVTNSQSTLEKGKLINDGKDGLVLPLLDAYLIVSEDDLESTKLKLVTGGYSTDWIKSHVKGLPYRSRSDEDFIVDPSSILQVVPREKDAINLWLSENNNPNRKAMAQSIKPWGNIYTIRYR